VNVLPSRPLPRRLVELAARLAETEDLFADWQLARRAPITQVYPDDEADIVTAAGQAVVPFAGDFSGGILALVLSGGEVEQAPVVSFDSEGGITVLGESFDDFLGLLASEEPDAVEDCWIASPQLQAWIREAGVEPHPSVTSRLNELGEFTRRFWVEWTASLRAATTRLRPHEVLDHALVLGERIGDVVLGMSRDALDERWGTPEIPSWAQSEDGVNAFYPRLPLAVRLDRSQRRVTGVTLYKGRHRALTRDGTDPMFMRATDAMTWLASLGLDASRSRSAIMVAALGLRFSLCRARGARAGEPWVESIELSQRAVPG
jgi:hypothetical protein